MRAITSVSLLLLAPLAFAQEGPDVSRGRLLYEAHCATCHTERLHTRETSTIRSYGALRAEVGRRAELTNRRFEPQELEDIIEFLDRSHYRLDLPRPPRK